jgi:RNA polymerase sigma-70 factor (ECF subfamily)
MAMCAQEICDPDVQLMLRVTQGDEEAFDELCRRYRRQLSGFLYSLCWNADAAQDYAQEVLVCLWLARERYEPTGSFRSYIYKIARNHWLSALRKRKCRPEPMLLEEIWETVEDESGLERLLIARYEDRRIKLAIADLPERYRLVFVLSHFEGMKYAEVAEILEIPVGTVKSRMSAAVRILRDKLSKETED